MKDYPYIKKIVSVFAGTANRYKAHKLAAPILLEMSRDKSFMHDVIRHNFSQPGYWNRKRLYNTLMFDVVVTSDFHIVVNIFPALPDKAADVTFQSIHHHGGMLLTTVSALGPGYSAFVFKKGFEINKQTHETKMEVDRFYYNPLYNIEFVDSWTPHVVFYPTETSVTIALWSNEKKQLTESLKQFSFLKKYKTTLSHLINLLGLKRILGINYVEYFDFYIENSKVKALRERLHYPEGTNENFIRNMLAFAQKTGFDDYTFINSFISRNDINDTAKKWIKKYSAGEKITEEFEECHLNIPKINLKKEEIETAFKNY
ncbi:MAG: hypothetical protein HYU69_02400 [Bacteroidetes bacterium]|nr:hypothetical protein [Bacteroidota bacterium]